MKRKHYKKTVRITPPKDRKHVVIKSRKRGGVKKHGRAQGVYPRRPILAAVLLFI